MNIRQRVANFISPTTKNSMGQDISRRFLKYGNNKPLVQDWSQIVMTDQDSYTGYGYGAINNKANRVAQLAENNLITKASKAVEDAAKKSSEPITHPYIKLIDESLDFDNYAFWYDISTYLDLEGVYYLFALRNKAGNRTGDIQYFKLLNPFNIRRIINVETKEVGGYVESRDGLVREIPPHMIIDIRELNPFDDNDPYSMIDASKDSTFTMKQSGDYTRHSLKNNMAAPGIISTDVELPTEEFINFRSRVINQEKGEPLFGNGAGAITWDAMQIDMDKAGLKDISEINLSQFTAVSGMSKTMFGIEQSGVTRDSASIQKDLYVENQAMPRLQKIISALNQDYKKYYADDYAKNGYKLVIDNPLKKDREAELKDTEIKTKNVELFTTLVNKGYDEEVAAKYVNGEIDLMELSKPTNPPIMPMLPAAPANKPDNTDDQVHEEQSNEHEHHHDHVPVVRNALDEDGERMLNTQQAALQNAVVNVEEKLTADVLARVSKAKNAFENESDIVYQKDRKEAERELELAIATFYGIIFPLYATTVLNRRAQEFGALGSFKLNNATRTYIKETAKKAASSHISTVLDDLLKEVQEQALAGASQQEMTSAIRKKYAEIGANRAKTIARTETNRAFTRSQYEADKQFITQNGFEGRAYKKWITRSSNPCPFCQAKATEPPIPFDNAFAEVGDELAVTFEENGITKVRKQIVGFENAVAGNLHPNCNCAYQLIIE